MRLRTLFCKYNDWVTVGVLVVMGFWIRSGWLSYSLWNDEAHVVLMTKFIEMSHGLPTGLYQVLTYYLTLLSMKVFGTNELGARLIYVIVGSLIPAITYLVGKKYFDKRTALLGSLAVVFSYVEIAWSRQVRPYIILQAALLMILLIKDWKIKLSVWLIALLFHTSAIFLSPYILWIVWKENKNLNKKIVLLGIGGLIVLFWKLDVWQMLDVFCKSLDFQRIYRKVLHFKIFWRHHFWLLSTAGIGWILNLKDKTKNEISLALVITTIIAYLGVWLRPEEATYVRYTLITFPLFFIYAAWILVQINNYVWKNKQLSVIVAGVGMLMIMKMDNNLGFNPYRYYSINHDVRENPLADYKYFFNQMKPLLQNNPETVIVDAWFDRTLWYLGKLDFFMIDRKDHRGKCDNNWHFCFITSTSELERMIRKRKKVLVIIEEWPSLASEEMKNWVRQNLEFKYRVCDNQLANENWCISLYAKGIK